MKLKYLGLIGDTEDLTLTYIKWLCTKVSIPTIELSENTYGQTWIYEYRDQDINDGFIHLENQTISLNDLSGLFVRLNFSPSFDFGNLNPVQKQIAIRERRLSIKHLINNIKKPVVNKPNSGLSNCSKPFQMNFLSKLGFKVPKWIVTNDPIKIQEFNSKFSQGTIVKSCSGLRSHVKMVDDELISDISKGSPPVIIQEFINGFDCRTHVIDKQIFPTKIVSNGVDYRFEENPGDYAPCSLPRKLEELCVKATELDNLALSGFDFKVTSDGIWYCLEMNPVPTFIPYELSTQQPIGEAVINYLTT